MLILTVGGGIGNQMFQYGYARYLQELLKEEYIYINDCDVIREYNRQYSLGHCNVKNTKILPRSVSRPLSNVLKNARRIAFRIMDATNESAECFKKMNRVGIYYHQDVYKYYESEIAKLPIRYIEGGFQSWKYFSTINSLKEELRIISPVEEKNIELLEKIRSCESVCIHIRRGDYLSAKYQELNICNYDYYLRGIQYINNMISNPVYFVFSNTIEDLDWIKNNYDFPYNVIYVKQNNSDYEELRLMYSCKHFIISNSTFSWWAQYLSYSDGITIAPDIWNRKHWKGTEDLYLPGWVRIQVEGA